MIPTVYFFLIDYRDNADYFRIGVLGQDRDKIYNYLCLFSKDVRCLDSKPLGKKDKGLRKLPNNLGTIVSCVYYADKVRNNEQIPDSKVSSLQKAEIDKRHTRIDDNGYFRKIY